MRLFSRFFLPLFLPFALSLFALLGFTQAQTPVELEPERFSYLLLQKPFGESKDDSFGIPGARSSKNYTWSKSKVDKNAKAQWQVVAPKEEEYTVVALIKLQPSAEVKLRSSLGEISAIGEEEGGWQRLVVGSLPIAAGASEIEIEVPESAKTELKALELIPTSQWAKHLERVAEFRAKGAENNFTEKVYGVMFHWGNWSVSPDGEGTTKEWPKMFEELDIEKWADMIVEMGAGYVVFTVSWGEFFVAGPIKSVESINPGRSTLQFDGRDYFMEIADALNARGIELILYFHHGQGDARRLGEEKGTWWRNLNRTLAEGAEAKPDFEGRDIFNANYRAIIGEMGEHYGEKLYGWWFDDGCLLYPQDFYEVSWNARKGNPRRLITYNNSKLAPYTDFQDYAAGELTRSYPADGIEDGILVKGRNRGLIPFGLSRVENDWSAHRKTPKIIVKGKGGGDGFAGSVMQAAERGYNITFNLMMYTDGSVHPASMEKLVKAKAAMEAAGYERDFPPIQR